jgi:segregation and condensation protein A
VGHVVSTPQFEGPLELLHRQIVEHHVDILDVPLAPVVDAFVAHLAAHREELTLDALSEFLQIAAILVELKSQRLLPGPDEVEDEEELSGYEERDLLLARLLECRAYAAAADVLARMAELASRSVPREAGLDDGFVLPAPDRLMGITPTALADAYVKATAERPEPQVDLSHVTVDQVSVSETVQRLAERLPTLVSVSFRELTDSLISRIEVIVHFLAVLELCKLGKVSLGQGSTFGDLQVAWLREERHLMAVVGGGSFELVDDYEG